MQARFLVSVSFFAIVVAFAGCGGSDMPAPSADAGVTVDSNVPCNGPEGLYVPNSCTELAEGVRAYTPTYELWADGATKDRFMFLPAGTTIDTTDVDGWIFPVGTKLYKTFSVDGLRIETRVLEKVSDMTGIDGWTMRVFAWNAEQTAVSEVTDGVVDALGTAHDIPRQSYCVRCHQGATDVGLGVSAIQLNHAGSGVTLDGLASEGRLSLSIVSSDAVVPGNATEQAALGYMHANCSHCHGGAAPAVGLDMRIRVGDTDVTGTTTYTTAVGVASGWRQPPEITERIVAGSPDTSAVVARMSRRGDGDAMPPIATEEIDEDGVALVRAWISSLH